MRPASLALGLLLAIAVAPDATMAHGSCSHETVHTYAAPGGAGARLYDPTTGNLLVKSAAGSAHVWDSETGDCDGDGLPANFDGDLDVGVGGFAFGHGPRAAWCDYHEEVAGTVTVMDVVFGNTVAFVTGHNDARGFLWDPLSGNPTCLTDGLIAPGIDPDDCLSEPGKGTQAVVCGGGADGLLWGFILASSNGPGGFSNPGTAGTVTSP